MLEKPSRLYDRHGIPTHWFNIIPLLEEYLGEPLPLPKGTDEQMERVGKIIVPECLKQEMSQEPWIEIPEELRQMYHWPLGRPRQLTRVREIEKYLGVGGMGGVEIWLMLEGFGSPTGSHKPNTALAQGYFAKQAGKKVLVTETGAGQWGLAVSDVVGMLGLEKAIIFWSRNVMERKPNRLQAMLSGGAEVYPSPSEKTQAGRDILAQNPNHPGDLGGAISEGVETAAQDSDAVYVLGSVLNHVLMHQTIIGLEAMRQLKENDRRPDFMISCFGGGSNFGGFILPILGEMLTEGKRDIRFMAYQSESFPNLAEGEYKYDSPDHAGLLPQLKMYTLGTHHQGDPIRAGGLQYHGAAPILSLLRYHGYIEAYTFPKNEEKVLEAAKIFARYTSWKAALESAYSLRGVFDLALALKGRCHNWHPVIVGNVSGRGDMEMETYKS